MDWLTDHWVGILAIVGGIDVILGVITKWTKTTWDDNAYAIIHNILDKFFRPKT